MNKLISTKIDLNSKMIYYYNNNNFNFIISNGINDYNNPEKNRLYFRKIGIKLFGIKIIKSIK
jgi:hypothetical protein